MCQICSLYRSGVERTSNHVWRSTKAGWNTCSVRTMNFYYFSLSVWVGQPCGSDSVRGSAAVRMLWFEYGGGSKNRSRLVKPFSFCCKNHFPHGAVTLERPKTAGSPPGSFPNRLPPLHSQSGAHLWAAHEALLKEEAPYLHVCSANWRSALFPQLQNTVDSTSLGLFQCS